MCVCVCVCVRVYLSVSMSISILIIIAPFQFTISTPTNICATGGPVIKSDNRTSRLTTRTRCVVDLEPACTRLLPMTCSTTHTAALAWLLGQRQAGVPWQCRISVRLCVCVCVCVSVCLCVCVCVCLRTETFTAKWRAV